MARLVMKFGGTSMGDIERVRKMAAHVKREVDGGAQVAVVVSAMGNRTDELVDLTLEMSPLHDAREYDAIVSSGEQVSAGMLALALQDLGLAARSWMGWQVPIHTTDAHSSARITKIEPQKLLAALKDGEVAVIAGFQGVSPDGRIATLGRGGSDTSAVAIAAAVEADRCDIYTDVDGVYTADPRVVAQARKLDKISYEEMLELASQGFKVLQTRSVELAMLRNVRLKVLSAMSASDGLVAGTLVCGEDEIMEQELVTGIACNQDEAKITLLQVSDKPGVAASIFGPLADSHINVDMIVQNVSADGTKTDMTFTVGKGDLDRAVAVIEKSRDKVAFKGLLHDKDVAKISVVGVGMRSHAGVAQRMFDTLAQKGINIQVISTSEIKVSVLIEAEYAELAVRALHTAYGLDAA